MDTCKRIYLMGRNYNSMCGNPKKKSDHFCPKCTLSKEVWALLATKGYEYNKNFDGSSDLNEKFNDEVVDIIFR